MIEENEQKNTVSNSIVRLCHKIGVLCLVRLYTSKDPKHDRLWTSSVPTIEPPTVSSSLLLWHYFVFSISHHFNNFFAPKFLLFL